MSVFSKPAVRSTLGALGAIALIAGAFLVWVVAQIPGRGADRIELSQDVVGVWAAQSYVWIVRTPHGAVLIDAGGEADATRVRKELEAMGRSVEQVHAILLTHGHKDHWTGAAAFPKARVYVGPGEAAVLTEAHLLTSPAGTLTRTLLPKPRMPAAVEELADGQELSIDTVTFQAIHVPGHTPGSTMFLYEDVLFTGDSLLTDDGELVAPPSFLSESDAELRRSLERLRNVAFSRTADGHAGVGEGGGAKLAALLAIDEGTK